LFNTKLNDQKLEFNTPLNIYPYTKWFTRNFLIQWFSERLFNLNSLIPIALLLFGTTNSSSFAYQLIPVYSFGRKKYTLIKAFKILTKLILNSSKELRKI